MADIEGGAVMIEDQIRGGGHAEQHEGDPVVIRVLRAGIVRGADRGKEVLAEGQG